MVENLKEQNRPGINVYNSGLITLIKFSRFYKHEASHDTIDTFFNDANILLLYFEKKLYNC